MPNRLFSALLVAFVAVTGASASAFAATDATSVATTAAESSTAVTISRPQIGDTVVNSRLEITGTAPVAVLVSVGIIDTDLKRSGIAHQPHGRVDGSVTSDAGGHWVFVPQVKMVPGRFAVTASYNTADNATIDSATVAFVVVNESGQSAVPSSSLKWKLGIVLALLAAGVLVFRTRRRGRHRHEASTAPTRSWLPSWVHSEMDHYRRERAWPASLPETQPLFMNTIEGRSYQHVQTQRLRDMDDEMKGIERSLAETAQALERSNTTIATLRRRLGDELRDTASDPETEPALPKKT